MINNEKWNYPDIANPTSRDDEIVKMAKDVNCKEDDLIILSFAKGWFVE
jgi:hypothetical protein